MSLKAWVFLFIFILGSWVLFISFSNGKDNSSAGSPLALTPGDAAVVAAGEAIYGQYCASCHGRNLEGQPDWRQRLASGRLPAPPHDETGHTWHHPDRTLFGLTKFGPGAVIGDPAYQSDMPAYEGMLSDEEILAVLSFIKSRWPKAVRRQHDQINQRATQAGQ